MKKYFLVGISLLAAAAILAGIFVYSCGRNKGTAKTESYEEITMILPTYGYVPEHMDQVTELLNEISEEKYGIKVNYQFVSVSDMTDVCRLKLKAGEEIDLMPCLEGNNLQAYISDGLLSPLDDLITKDAAGIRQLFYSEIWSAMGDGDTVYAVPTVGEFPECEGMLVRSDFLSAAGLDYAYLQDEYDHTSGSYISRIDQVLTPAFQTVFGSDEVLADGSALSSKQLVCGNAGYKGLFCQCDFVDFDGFGNTLGGVLNGGAEIVNLYESEDYREEILLLKKWQDAGYIFSDSIAGADNSSVLYETGKSLGLFSTMSRDRLDGYGQETAYINLKSNEVTTEYVEIGTWVIPVASEHKEAAMKILNLMYTDEEYVRTFFNGTRTGQQLEDYAAPVDWMFGNIFLEDMNFEESKVEMAQQNFTMLTDNFGFLYDESEYAETIADLEKILSEYLPDLEKGIAEDVDATLAEMNARLYAAGLQEVMDDKAAQLAAWKAGK